jgi:TM2 domain-containing membrane protein YozV
MYIDEGPGRIVSALLAITFGWLGVHKFLRGHAAAGVVTLATCGGFCHLIGIIEGLIYLLKTDEEFRQTYIVEKKMWF